MEYKSSEFDNKQQGNILFAYIGAIGGLILGIFLWIIVSKLGFISGLVGFLMLHFATTGFEKLGGMKINKQHFIVLLVLTVLSIILSVLSNMIFFLFDTGFTLKESLQALPYLLKDPHNMKILMKDGLIGLGLATWSSWSFVKQKLSSDDDLNINNER